MVLDTRKKFSLWGKYKIAVILLREYGKKVSASTVGRIISKHIKRGTIRPVWFYYGHLRAKRARVFYNHAKRWKH